MTTTVDVETNRAVHEDKRARVKIRLATDEAFFSKAIFPDHIKGSVPLFHNQVYSIYNSEAEKIALAAPRDHAKSTITCLIHVLFRVLHRKSSFVVIISNTKPNAKLFLDDIKTQVEFNSRLRHYYGNLKDPNKWTEDDIELCFDPADPMKNAKIMARGAGQQVRGLKWRGRRPDLIILDDIEDEENTGTADQREKILKWFDGSVIPACAPGGQIIVIGTVLHYDSLLAQLLNVEKYPEFVSTKFRAINEKKSGERFALWEARYSLERLLRMRRVYAKRGRLHIFMQEFQNEAISEELRTFKRSYKRTYAGYVIRDVTGQSWLVVTARNGVELVAPEVLPLSIGVGIDLAVSRRSRADYTVLQVLGTDPRNRAYRLETVRGRFTPKEVLDHIFDLNKRYKPDLFGIETNAFQVVIVENLIDAMDERGEYVPYKEITQDEDKERRFLNMQPRFAVGGVWWRDGDDDWEAELYDWPKVAHDDQLDALEMAIRVSSRPEAKEFESALATASDEEIREAVSDMIERLGEKAWQVL